MVIDKVGKLIYGCGLGGLHKVRLAKTSATEKANAARALCQQVPAQS